MRLFARRIARAGWVVGWPVRALLVALIRLYRATLSGLLGGQCRFHPSCSVYAEGCIRRHGAVKGSALAAWRFLRCAPWSRGGPDPVPTSPRDGEAAAAAYDSVIQHTVEPAA